MRALRPDTGSDTVDAVLHAAHRVRQAADAELRRHGLSLSSYKLLRALHFEACSMRELSQVLRVAPRTVTDIVDGLEKHGLVERGVHAHDRRVTLIRITPEGSRQLRRAKSAVERVHERSIGGLTMSERAALVALLDRVGVGSADAVGSQAAAPRAAV